LKHNDFTLDWIALGQELEGEWEQLRGAIEQARERRDAGTLSQADWRAAAREMREKIQALNKRVIGYNLRAPAAAQRRPYPIDPDIKDA
jgi:uncharacterized coiled-coil DUF342 family protein